MALRLCGYKGYLFGFFFSALTFFAPLRAHDDALIESINSTGLFTYYILNKSQNTVFSPFSMGASLLMAYSGARGDTASQMASAMHLTIPQNQVAKTYSRLEEELSSGNGTVKIGNSMWVDKKTPILSSYKKLVEDDYNGLIQYVAFNNPKKAAYEINSWVYNHTDKKISLLVQPQEISSSTKMMLINALFVKGAWQTPFPTQRTGMKQFLTHQNEWVNAPTMNQTSQFPYYEDQEMQIVALPLENLNSRLALVLFLPKEKQSSVFDFFYSKDQTKPEGFLSYLDKLEKRPVEITLPKFIISQKINIGSFLSSIGMSLVTSGKADFSGIDGKKDLFISKATQQSVISIDEGGLFATASSGITFSLKSSIPFDNPAQFTANRPFLYALIDMESKLMLFIGECLDPTQTGIIETEDKKNK